MSAPPRTREPARLARTLAALLVCACEGPSSAPDGSTTGSSSTSHGDASSGAGSESTGTTGEPAPPTVCAEPTTLTASPRSISEAVAFINALPRPLTLDCFLERLERPLAIAATSSIVSLQPAVGQRSPRVFLFSGELVMSIAVDGPGVELLEFGEPIAPTRSIKAEVEFPLDAAVADSAPFERIDRGGASICGVCHRGESPVPGRPFAYASDTLKFVDTEETAVAALRAEYGRCDPDGEPARCARLTALFGHGPVQQAAFPAVVQTIFDYE